MLRKHQRRVQTNGKLPRKMTRFEKLQSFHGKKKQNYCCNLQVDTKNHRENNVWEASKKKPRPGKGFEKHSNSCGKLLRKHQRRRQGNSAA